MQPVTLVCSRCKSQFAVVTQQQTPMYVAHNLYITKVNFEIGKRKADGDSLYPDYLESIIDLVLCDPCTAAAVRLLAQFCTP